MDYVMLSVWFPLRCLLNIDIDIQYLFLHTHYGVFCSPIDDMADMEHIPIEPCQIQSKTPFISTADLFSTDSDISLLEADYPLVIDTDVDCNASIDYEPPTHHVRMQIDRMYT